MMKEATTKFDTYFPNGIEGLNRAIEELNKEDLSSSGFFVKEIERLYPEKTYKQSVIPIALNSIEGAVNPVIIVFTKRMIKEGNKGRNAQEFLKIRTSDGMLLYDPNDNTIKITVLKQNKGIVVRDIFSATPEVKDDYFSDIGEVVRKLILYIINV